MVIVLFISGGPGLRVFSRALLGLAFGAAFVLYEPRDSK